MSQQKVLICLGLVAILAVCVHGGAYRHGGVVLDGFQGAAWYGRDSGAGGYAGLSLVSGLAASGYASPYGASGGNYLQGLRFLHDGSSAGFGGFGASSGGGYGGSNNHGVAYTGSVAGK